MPPFNQPARFWSSITTASSSSSRLPLSLLLSRNDNHPSPFFRPNSDLREGHDDGTRPDRSDEGGKGKRPIRQGDEELVDDQEWSLRVGSGILHLRTTLPHLFDQSPPREMFPPSVYSNHVSLRLPAPLPLKISSLSLYSMTFALARHGMHALHTDLHASLHKLAVSPTSSSQPVGTPGRARTSKTTAAFARKKQVRVVLEVCGMSRLGVQREPTSWQTSSLYTFSSTSGLITEHLVETIRPLPGESVGAWLSARLGSLRAAESEGYQTCPGVGMVGLNSGTGREDRMGLVRVVEVIEDPPAAESMSTSASAAMSRARDRGFKNRYITASRYRGIHTCHSPRCHSRSSSGSHPERDLEVSTTPNPVQARLERRPALIQALRQNPEISDEQDAAQELDWIERETPRQATRGRWEERVDDRVKRRGGGEPLQYILGSTPFGPLDLDCRAPTLIPRPETADIFSRLAIIVRKGLGRVTGGKVRTPLRVLDLYTGSGCVALLLAHELRGWSRGRSRNYTVVVEEEKGEESDVRVLGIDKDRRAVELARMNGGKTGLGRWTAFEEGDALDVEDVFRLVSSFSSSSSDGEGRGSLGEKTTRGLKMVVANPPYIPLTEYLDLPRSVREWEDLDALCGDGHHRQVVDDRTRGDGLEHYRALARNLHRMLELDEEDEDGWDEAGLPRVAVEIGDGQGERVGRIMREESGGWVGRTECWSDLYDRERMVVGWRR